MSVVNFNQTVTGNADYVIPSTAFNISLVVAGGSGGTGGGDSNGNGSGGGAGRYGSFTLPNYTARTLSLRPGGRGPDGPGCFGRGTSGGSGSIPGGGGGSASGCSGSGAGGGGASGVFDSLFGNWIIVAGGGAGGGGGAWNRPASTSGGNAGSWGGIGSVSGGSGGNNAVCGDGSGGGGGGGGRPGGGGGRGGCDNGQTAQGGGGGGSGYNPSAATITGDSFHSGNGYITLSYTDVQPELTSFSYTPIPQTSGLVGTPDNTVTLNWTVKDASLVQIYSGATLVSSTSYGLGTNSGFVLVNTGLQSVASNTGGVNTPATKNYTLVASYGSVTVSSTITVQVYNDNTPSSVPISSTTTTSVSLNNLAANTQYIVEVGPVRGIDMKTLVTCNTTGLQASLTGGGGWSNSIVIDPNSIFYLRFFSLTFNTDPSGLTNPRTLSFDVGTSTNNTFVATTRAPDVQETNFEFANSVNNLPNPDIDQLSGGTNQYIVSPTTVIVNDVEIDVPVKVDKPDAQVRITSGGVVGQWIDAQQI